jgi:hypothetical protein
MLRVHTQIQAELRMCDALFALPKICVRGFSLPTAMQLKTAFFWIITQRVVVVSY